MHLDKHFLCSLPHPAFPHPPHPAHFHSNNRMFCRTSPPRVRLDRRTVNRFVFGFTSTGYGRLVAISPSVQRLAGLHCRDPHNCALPSPASSNRRSPVCLGLDPNHMILASPSVFRCHSPSFTCRVPRPLLFLRRALSIVLLLRIHSAVIPCPSSAPSPSTSPCPDRRFSAFLHLSATHELRLLFSSVDLLLFFATRFRIMLSLHLHLPWAYLI